MESIGRPVHCRSKSSPVPISEPWGQSISSSPSMVLPCSSDSLCGLGEAIEGMVSSQEDEDGAFHHVEEAIQYEANTPTLESLPITPVKNSSDSLCQPQANDETCASTEDVSPPHTPPGGYQKRGRFLIWPVTMDPPAMGIPLPFFGMTPQ
eukprot:scaffold34645_cov201-Amphora_coffeaeformis.AAC.2